MKRPVRDDDGTYHIKGKHYPELFGSRQQVVNGTAYKTTGELTKKDLMMNKWGRIVSAKKHKTAKKEKRLEKAGYFAKKGKFGFVKKTARKSRKAKKKGGQLTDSEVVVEAPKVSEDVVEAPKVSEETEDSKPPVVMGSEPSGENHDEIPGGKKKGGGSCGKPRV